MIRESGVEGYLCAEVAKLDGCAFKFVSPGHAGVVDRVIVLPWLPVWFVETKRPGAGLAARQKDHRDWLIERGQRWSVLDTKARVDEWIAQRAYELYQRAADL